VDGYSVGFGLDIKGKKLGMDSPEKWTFYRVQGGKEVEGVAFP
jgi:hypothetical protein